MKDFKQQALQKFWDGMDGPDKQNLSESKFSDLLDCRIYFEHGYVCLRTENGKLLWDKKASDLDNYIGVSLDDILKEALINYEAI